MQYTTLQPLNKTRPPLCPCLQKAIRQTLAYELTKSPPENTIYRSGPIMDTWPVHRRNPSTNPILVSYDFSSGITVWRRIGDFGAWGSCSQDGESVVPGHKTTRCIPGLEHKPQTHTRAVNNKPCLAPEISTAPPTAMAVLGSTRCTKMEPRMVSWNAW